MEAGLISQPETAHSEIEVGRLSWSRIWARCHLLELASETLLGRCTSFSGTPKGPRLQVDAPQPPGRAGGISGLML